MKARLEEIRQIIDDDRSTDLIVCIRVIQAIAKPTYAKTILDLLSKQAEKLPIADA